MRCLTIQARSYDSAQALFSALLEFHAELLGNDDQGYTVSVQLGNSDGQVIKVLDAIERYVTERETFARVEMDGHRYTIHGESIA